MTLKVICHSIIVDVENTPTEQARFTVPNTEPNVLLRFLQLHCNYTVSQTMHQL